MAQVRWDLAQFQRAGIIGRAGGMVELKPVEGTSYHLAFGAFAHALGAANGFIASQEAAGRQLYAAADGPTPGLRGPIAIFKECEPLEALTLFLQTLAADLEKQGISGQLVPIPKHEDDRWYGDNPFGALTAFLLLPVDRERVMATYDTHARQPDIAWWVDEESTTPVLGPLIDWVLDAGDRIEVWHEFTSTTSDRDEVAPLVQAAFAHGVRSIHVRASSGPARMRQLKTRPFGQVTIQDFEPGVPRAVILERLVGLSTSAAQATQQCWIQEADTFVSGRYELLTSYPPRDRALPELICNSMWRLFHLDADHVFDAFVAQILTDRQLARVRSLDPTRWEVSSIGADRHLVRHRKAEQWLDDDPVPLPERPEGRRARRRPVHAAPPEVLAQARADFGDAIMTLETLASQPFIEPMTGQPFPA